MSAPPSRRRAGRHGVPGRLEQAVKAGPLHPFQPLMLAIADHCRAQGAAETAYVLGDRGAVLAAYEPALAGLPGQEPFAPVLVLSARAARARLHRSLAGALAAFAEAQPVLLVIDDLQWADEGSLSFLGSLDAAYFAATGVLLLGTYRAEEGAPALRAVLDAPGAVRIDLGTLDEAAVSRVVGDMLAMADPPPALVRLLAERSGGNPFFIAEHLRLAIDEGLLLRGDAGNWQVASAADGARVRLARPALQPARSGEAPARRPRARGAGAGADGGGARPGDRRRRPRRRDRPRRSRRPGGRRRAARPPRPRRRRAPPALHARQAPREPLRRHPRRRATPPPRRRGRRHRGALRRHAGARPHGPEARPPLHHRARLRQGSRLPRAGRPARPRHGRLGGGARLPAPRPRSRRRSSGPGAVRSPRGAPPCGEGASSGGSGAPPSTWAASPRPSGTSWPRCATSATRRGSAPAPRGRGRLPPRRPRRARARRHPRAPGPAGALLRRPEAPPRLRRRGAVAPAEAPSLRRGAAGRDLLPPARSPPGLRRRAPGGQPRRADRFVPRAGPRLRDAGPRLRHGAAALPHRDLPGARPPRRRGERRPPGDGVGALRRGHRRAVRRPLARGDHRAPPLGRPLARRPRSPPGRDVAHPARQRGADDRPPRRRPRALRRGPRGRAPQRPRAGGGVGPGRPRRVPLRPGPARRVDRALRATPRARGRLPEPPLGAHHPRRAGAGAPRRRRGRGGAARGRGHARPHRSAAGAGLPVPPRVRGHRGGLRGAARAGREPGRPRRARRSRAPGLPFSAVHAYAQGLFPIGRPHALRRLRGLVASIAGHEERARHLLTRSLAEAQRLGMPVEAARAHEELARRGTVGEAARERHLEEARAILRRLGRRGLAESAGAPQNGGGSG